MQSNSKHDETVEYTRKDPSKTEVVLEVTIKGKDFVSEYDKQMKKIQSEVRAKGFRKGKAPRELIEDSHAGEARKMALEHLIGVYAGKAIEKEKLSPVMPPTVDVTSMDENKDIHIAVTVYVIPEITIPDLSTLKTRKLEAPTEKKEVDELMKRLWGEHRGNHKDKTDAWAKELGKKLGFASKTIKDLEKEIKKAIEQEKNRIADQRYNEDILKEAVVLSNVQIPDEMITHEASEREKSFNASLEQMKVSVDDFCKERGVTLDQLKEQWNADSKEAVEADVFLSAFSLARNVVVTPEELDAEVSMVKQRSKNPSDELFDNPQWRSYIQRVLLKRKAYSEFSKEVAGAVVASKNGHKAPAKKTETDKK